MAAKQSLACPEMKQLACGLELLPKWPCFQAYLVSTALLFYNILITSQYTVLSSKFAVDEKGCKL
jgi:hypothetical protein